MCFARLLGRSMAALGVSLSFILLILLAIVAAINVKATFVLAHSTYYSPKQKLFQLVIVWLLPVVGAVLVWSLATDTKIKQSTTNLQDHSGYDDGYIRHEHSSFDVGSDGGGDGH